METMTDRQMQFLTWLITTATDKCQTMEEVREMNEQIREHAAGLAPSVKKSEKEENVTD